MNRIKSIATVIAGLAVVSAFATTTSAALVNPVGATASSEGTGFGATPAANVIDPTDLNGSNEHLVQSFPTPNWLNAGDFAGGASVDDEWIFVDLGSDFNNATSVNIWNYVENASGTYLSTRGIAQYELWIAGTGATLPVGQLVTPFTVGNGWTQVTTGTLTQGPVGAVGGTTAIAPTDVLSLGGNTGIRYIGIDVVTHYGETFGAGLAQIQVVTAEVPAPAALPAGVALLGLAAARRRRNTRR